MATNRKYPQSEKYSKLLKWTAADTRASNIAKSNDPVIRGNVPGVAMNDADTGGKVVAQEDGVFTLLVAGIDDGGTSGADRNVAVNGGDKIFFDKTKNPPLSKRTGGTFFGSAYGDVGVEMVASGGTTTSILVEVNGGAN